MKKAGVPLNAGKIVELTGLERKEVDKAMKLLKAEEAIVSPKNCFWQPKWLDKRKQKIVVLHMQGDYFFYINCWQDSQPVSKFATQSANPKDSDSSCRTIQSFLSTESAYLSKTIEAFHPLTYFWRRINTLRTDENTNFSYQFHGNDFYQPFGARKTGAMGFDKLHWLRVEKQYSGSEK